MSATGYFNWRINMFFSKKNTKRLLNRLDIKKMNKRTFHSTFPQFDPQNKNLIVKKEKNTTKKLDV